MASRRSGEKPSREEEEERGGEGEGEEGERERRGSRRGRGRGKWWVGKKVFMKYEMIQVSAEFL